jgi:flagellar assembly protein FliH
VQKREKRARARGAEEGKSQVQAEYERSLTSVRQEVADAVKAFQSEREAYYHRIETEVVQLALSMARHILHRESQLDPSLLAGVVRVALGKFEAETGIRLRVHRSRLDAWRDSFAYFTDDKPAPELVPDDSLRPDQCILETPLGSTDLSLETQLKEIAQGFFDLLAQRPGQLK